MNSEPVAATPDVVELEIPPGTTAHSKAPKPIPASQIIKAALESGAHPSEIRRVLQDQGISWKYSITGQGSRERERRQRQFRLCSEGCGRSYPKGSNGSLAICDDCLKAKWSQ